MLLTDGNIAPCKDADKERLREWARFRPTRSELDALERVWRDGLAEPTDKFHGLFAPRDAFPRSPADGLPGLLPRLRYSAFPAPGGSGRYVLVRASDRIVFGREEMERHEAWHAGAAAVRASNAEFTLTHQPPGAGRLFVPRGHRFLAHPNGRGAWAWSHWGGDDVARGERDVSKAEILQEAEVTIGCEGQIAIVNFVPTNRTEWEAIYAYAV